MAPTGYHLTNINGLHASGLDKARTVLCDQQSEGYRSYVIDALLSHTETNEVASAFDQYIVYMYAKLLIARAQRLK